MAKATLTFSSELLSELMTLVHARSKTEAVLYAVKEEIRRRKKMQIKAAAGKMEFTVEPDELRHGDHRLG